MRKISMHQPIGTAQSVRMVALLGNHQSIGAIQIKRVNGILGSRRSNGSEEKNDLNHENIYKGIHDDESSV